MAKRQLAISHRIERAKMSDQDQNLYGQLYSQLLSKLSHGTALPSLPQADVVSEPISQKLISQEGAVAKGDAQISRLIGDHDFQLMYPFHDWWWPEPPEGYIDQNAYLFLSRMPLSLWNPTKAVTIYESSDKDLYSTYRNVLLAAPKIGVDTVDSSGSLTHEPREHWITEYSKVLTESEKPSSPSDKKPGFVRMTTDAGTIACENYLVARGKDWISELKKKAEEKDSTSSTSAGDEETLANFSLDLSTALPAMSVDVPKLKDAFFRVFTSDRKWEDFNISHHDKKVSVSVKVGAVTRVPVLPDPHWYDSGYLQTLAKRDSWNPPFTRADVFGEKGLLSQRMNRFIAAYHIAFKVTVSPEVFKKFEPRFKAANGFRIGPFHFGAGADIASKHCTHAVWEHKTHSDTSTFEGESMADYPIIIGVTVERIVQDVSRKI